MKNPVNIKGTKSGMILVIDKDFSYDDIKLALKEKIIASKKFLGNASVAIAFEGKKLTDEEKFELVSIISKNSDLNVVCISDDDIEKEAIMRRSLKEGLKEIEYNSGQFYKGTLKNGQVVDFETSIIILGDVEEGAQVVSKGSIIVLGTLSGCAFAGVGGRKNVFIAALCMEPVMIRIGDSAGKPPENKKLLKKKDNGPKIAYCQDGFIYVDPISNDVLSDIL